MTKNLLTLFSIALTSVTIAQVSFTSQTSGTIQDLKGTTIIPGTTMGWACGSGGTILTTTNGGATWTAQSSGTTATLEDIMWGAHGTNGLEFVWACGSSATVVNTMDAGATWDIQSSGAPYAAYAIDFQSFANGIMVGDQFTATSTNGGNAWSPSMNTSTAYAVDFASGSTGWMCGAGGFIKKTTDGGLNWTDQVSGTNLALHGINFINLNEGWACGITGTVLHTTNGGTTWVAQTSNTANLISDIEFTDSQKGWACGYSGTMLRTTNGGVTWTPYFSTTTGTSAWLQSIALIDENNGWAVGSGGSLIRITDAGSSSAGINDLAELTLNVYPNPATNAVNIQTEEIIEEIEIYNAVGQLVQTEKNLIFSVENLPSGIYFIHLQSAKGKMVSQFIKK